jgi:hypothetical protein
VANADLTGQLLDRLKYPNVFAVYRGYALPRAFGRTRQPISWLHETEVSRVFCAIVAELIGDNQFDVR